MRNLPDFLRIAAGLVGLLLAIDGRCQDLPSAWHPSVQHSALWAQRTAARLHPDLPSCPVWLPEETVGHAAAVEAVLQGFGDPHTGVAQRERADRMKRKFGMLPFEVVRSSEGTIVRKSIAAALPAGARLLTVQGCDVAEVAQGWSDGFVNDVVAAELGVRAGGTVLLRWIDPIQGDTVSGAVEVVRDRRGRGAAGGGGRFEAVEGGVVLKPPVFSTLPTEWEELPQAGGVVLDLRGHGGGGVQEAVVLARRLTGYTGPLPQAVVLKGSPEARRLQPDRLLPGGGEDWEAVWKAVRSLPDGAVDTVRFQTGGTGGPHRTGRCAVLVDGGTSSAAAALADWLQRRGQAVVIGIPWAPSAGGTYGNAVRAADPETGLAIRVATAAFVWDSTAWGPCAGPGLPDLSLEPTAAAWAAGRDPVREAGVAWATGQPWRPDSATVAAWMSREAPERWALWRGIERELKPSGEWRRQAWEAVSTHATAVAWADLAGAQAERQAERQAGQPVDHFASDANTWAEAKTEARQRRDAALRAACPASSLPALEQLLNPSKPAVLHFGIHDRMNCGVCKPGEQ